MTIKDGEAGLADDVIRNVATFLQGTIQNTYNSFKNSTTDMTYDFATVDYFTDNTGYNDTVDLGNTDASWFAGEYYSITGGIAIHFNGSGWATVPHHADFENTSFSLSCWIKVDGTTNFDRVFKKGVEYATLELEKKQEDRRMDKENDQRQEES